MGHGGHGTESGDEAPEAFPQQSEDESKTQPLLTPLQLGPFKLNHRVVMAPLTRCRSYGCVPQKHAAVYYAQRTTPGGLIIAEATSVAEDGNGFPHTPGIWTQEQVEAWKPIVQAVHDKGGVFICQLWHVGRVSHTAYHNGAAPPSSTAQRVTQGQVTLPNAEGQADYSTPRAVATSEIPKYVNHFRVAARNAMEAGFDGVEIHGAHGYFIDQFLKDRINNRTDKYGGSLSNRCRFLEEVLTAVTTEIGPQRVGIRISPFTQIWDASDSNPNSLAHHIVTHVLNKFDLLYLHVVEPRFQFSGEVETEDSLWPIRRAYQGKLLAAGGFDQDRGNDAVKSGRVDAVVYGREFVANPDLVKRFALRAPLNKYQRETFYTQDPVVGYTDYPFLEEGEARQ